MASLLVTSGTVVALFCAMILSCALLLGSEDVSAQSTISPPVVITPGNVTSVPTSTILIDSSATNQTNGTANVSLANLSILSGNLTSASDAKTVGTSLLQAQSPSAKDVKQQSSSESPETKLNDVKLPPCNSTNIAGKGIVCSGAASHIYVNTSFATCIWLASTLIASKGWRLTW